MQLSMYMLEQWFSGRKAASIIQSGTRTITNARLFTDDLSLDDSCVYVGRTTDFFPSSSSPEVMMMHKNDIISITSTDLNTVFNEVLTIFDYYNGIEQLLYASIFRPDPEQCILSACEGLVGPMFIMAPDFRILGCSQNFSGQYVNTFWDTFVSAKEPTLDMVIQMRNSNAYTLMQATPHMVLFSEPNAFPYSYGIINTYHGSDGRVLGHYILASDCPITKFDRDIASIVLDALTILQAGTPSQAHSMNTSEDALLTKLIHGIDPFRTGQYLTALYSLSVGNYYYLAVAESAGLPANNITRKTFQKAICNAFHNCLATQIKNQIIFLFWSDRKIPLYEIEDTLQAVTDNSPIFWGISNEFSELDAATIFYEQAVYALSGKQHPVSFFCNRAVEYILSQPDATKQAFARHPLVMELEQISSDSGRELTNTLREYLLCERSVKQVAERLFVHRNTVNYRIDQLRNLHLIDFDDPYDRTYCLLSLLLSTAD